MSVNGCLIAGVFLELNGSFVCNFALLEHSDIDTSDDPAVVGGNLVCRTDNTTCCRGAEGLAQGEWYYHTGEVVVFASGGLPSGQIYRMRRGAQVVRLRRSGTAGTTTANGIYRCEVADQNGVLQTRYVGLYTEGASEYKFGIQVSVCFYVPVLQVQVWYQYLRPPSSH